MRARREKTVAQQCKYFEVENIYDYMVSVYINGNILRFGSYIKSYAPMQRGYLLTTSLTKCQEFTIKK